MGEQDALFCFMDGLCSWAKMELKTRGVQDLAFAIAAAESLLEFKRDSSKSQGKKPQHGGKSGGDRTSLSKITSLTKTKENGRKLIGTILPNSRSHVSYAMGLTVHSSAQIVGNSLLS